MRMLRPAGIGPLSTARRIGAPPSPARIQQRPGIGSIEAGCVAGRTVVTRAFAASPLKLLSPRSSHGSAWVFASTYGGGLVDGDQIQIDAVAHPGSRLFLGTQASTKVYRATERGAGQTLTARAGDGATIVAAPDPIACYAGARYVQRQRFDLAEGANLVLIDSLTSGRRARGERWAFERCETRTDIFVADRLVFRDALVLDPADGPLDSSVRTGGFDCLATALVLGPSLAAHATALLDFIARAPIRPISPSSGTPGEGRGGGSAETTSFGNQANAARTPALTLPRSTGGGESGKHPRRALVFSASLVGDGVVVRVAGPGPEAVMRWLRDRLSFVPQLLGDDPWARKW